MNCNPVPTLDDRINDIRQRTAEIINNDILPNERVLWADRRDDESVTQRTEQLELRAEIQEKVKKAGFIGLALGGQSWQEATMFDGVVLSTGGPE